MESNEKNHGKLEKGKEIPADIIECEMKINGENFTFIGSSIKGMKEEKGIIKVQPSENGSRVSIWGERTLPFELATTSDKLGLINGRFLFCMKDSIERGRIVRYQIDHDDNDDFEITEISVNNNGEYQIDEGKMKSEDNGRKLIFSIENINLLIEGFGSERKLVYSEEMLDNKYFIVEIVSQEEIEFSSKPNFDASDKRSHLPISQGALFGCIKGSHYGCFDPSDVTAKIWITFN